MSKLLHFDDATVSTTKSSSTSRIRPAACSDLRYERALLSAYGLESSMTLEELKRYVTTTTPGVASSSPTTTTNNTTTNTTTIVEGDSDLFRFLCTALNSSISNQKKHQQEEQKKLRDCHSSHTTDLDLQNAYSIVVLEMQIAQLNFDVAELRTREEEQLLLHDNLKKCTNRLEREKEHLLERIQQLQQTVETMTKTREESMTPMEELVTQHTECEARVLHLQNDYDQLQLETSQTFQEYKEWQSYEVELAEQVQQLRILSKQHALEKASIQLALDNTTRELETFQIQINDQNRDTQEAIQSQNDLKQQKEQLRIQIETQQTENNYMAQKLNDLKHGTCRGRAASSLEAIMADCPTPWSHKQSTRNHEQVECNPSNLESITTNPNKGNKHTTPKKPIHFTIQIGDHNKKKDDKYRDDDENSNSSSSSMSSVTIGTKRSLISTIFHPHVHFPFVHHHPSHMKSKKDTSSSSKVFKGIKKKISEEEVHSSEEDDDDDNKDLSDPLTYWKYRQET